MIIETFDNGWGPGIPLRDFQQQLLAQYLYPIQQDSTPTVVINSTWYTQDYHQQVKAQLATLQPKRIVLTAFMDPAIPTHDMFADFNCYVLCVGYYPGTYELDAWALIMHEHFSVNFDVSDFKNINTAFMCLNRKPHHHRRHLYSQLVERSLVDKNIVSLGGEKILSNDSIQGSCIAPNPGVDQYGIVNDIMSLGPAPAWQQCFLNVVTETVYNVDKEWFVSEKIYKPIIGERPFLVYAPNGARAWLEHIGLENYIDDFGDITDLELALPQHIPEFLEQLSNQSSNYFQKKYIDLRQKIQYNKHMLAQHVTATQNKITQGIKCPV
jgi:hypothetical protein